MAESSRGPGTGTLLCGARYSRAEIRTPAISLWPKGSRSGVDLGALTSKCGAILLGTQTAGSNVDTGVAGITTIGRLAGAQTDVRSVMGLIDDVRFYNRALAAEEVSQVFAGAQCR